MFYLNCTEHWLCKIYEIVFKEYLNAIQGREYEKCYLIHFAFHCQNYAHQK
jgi:hypothetical protein